MVCDREQVDLVVAHTVVLRQNDVNSMPPQLQLAAEAEDHFPEAAGAHSGVTITINMTRTHCSDGWRRQRDLGMA